VHAGVPVVSQTLDLVLHQQLFPLEFYDFQVIDRGMGQAIVDFLFKCLMLFLEFRKVRLHRHAACLLNQWLPDELSLAQTQYKSDVTPGYGPQQTIAKPLIDGGFSSGLNALVENVIFIGLGPSPMSGRQANQRWQ
jgi:hypothetical protein